MVRPPGARSLSLPQQALALRRDFPRANTSVMPGALVWQHAVTPTPLSREYQIRVSYRPGRYPEVTVADPPLVPDERGFIPHYYGDGALCLHDLHEWDATMLIAATILPWTVEWLAHYELWKRSGHWYGDGEPRASSKPDQMPEVAPGPPRNRAQRRRDEQARARAARHNR
jgi:hypothetical protein